jgi:hypothetical protein
MQRPENDLSWFDPAQGRFMAPGVGTWYGGSVRQLEIRSCRMMAGLQTACGTSASINDRVAGFRGPAVSVGPQFTARLSQVPRF